MRHDVQRGPVTLLRLFVVAQMQAGETKRRQRSIIVGVLLEDLVSETGCPKGFSAANELTQLPLGVSLMERARLSLSHQALDHRDNLTDWEPLGEGPFDVGVHPIDAVRVLFHSSRSI